MHADSVRGFNRFYTKQIGLLRKGYLDSPFSLSEVRVLYELVHRKHPIAAEISKELNLDAGYLSRLLAKLEKRGLMSRKASGTDGRQSYLILTSRGRQAFAPLEAKTNQQAAEMLSKLSSADQKRLVEAMHTIEKLLGAQPEPKAPYVLRSHQPGDMGWVVHRHGALYAAEYGWDESFEALTAEIVAKFIHNFDPKRERCWIAEQDGAMLGCVSLVKKSDRVAKLRLLLVEPSARGLGIGGRLVEECVGFAREVGYQKMTLWTQSNLRAARNIYKSVGFRLVKKWPVKQFGYEMVSETWDLKL